VIFRRCFGKWNTVFKRYRGWVKADVFKRLFNATSEDPDMEHAMFAANITRATQKALLAQGIAFVPQGRNLFGQLSVYVNLELGGITLGMKTTHERMPEVLEFFPRVKERLHSRASALSGGEQKQLEIGRALLLRPKVLLIDEPSIGLSPLIVQDVFRLLRRLAGQGTTVLMVEQNVKSALQYSDEAIALESGRLVLHKAAADILADPNMERLFLGGAHTAVAADATTSG
jgi:branched-chain amino acid transport system ATP-binding protein